MQTQVNLYVSHWKSLYQYNKENHRSTTMSNWKSLSTYNSGNHSINGYQSLWKQCPHVLRPATGQRLSISLEIRVHIHQATASRTFSPTGNQCPHIARANTASTAISVTGIEFTYNNGNHTFNGYTYHWKSMSTYKKDIHSIKGYQSHWNSGSTYNRGNHRSTTISPLEIRDRKSVV